MTFENWYSIYNLEMPAIEEAKEEILALPESAFDRYQNPFESKLVIRDKFNLPLATDRLMNILESWRVESEIRFNTKLFKDETGHYRGIFIYNEGDQLSPHLDAGIHPLTGKRKHVTAILYLGGTGDLEFWESSSGYLIRSRNIAPIMGTLVLFENNDKAYHSAAINNSDEPRIVLTTSFLSDQIDAFENKRQRAYFVPRPNEKWAKEMYDLRDKRSDSQQYAEVYRT